VEVAEHRYTSDAYHDFIGFQVSKPVLERAFIKIYGISLEDVFRSIDLSIATFRRSISTVIPKMTRVALLTRKAELVKEDHSFTRKKFLYNLKRAEYAKEWGRIIGSREWAPEYLLKYLARPKQSILKCQVRKLKPCI